MENEVDPKPSTARTKRNLVVCIDGTSNRFGDENTNVVELYRRLEKSSHQLTYYNSGIGTYANQSRRSLKYFFQALGGLSDVIFAWNVDKIITDAYKWLAENYEEGDEIYVFGFSRGAYQVRALAGMIAKVGLIHKGNDAQIPFAYELYASHGDSVWTSLPIIILELLVAGFALFATRFIFSDFLLMLSWAVGNRTLGSWLLLKALGRSSLILLAYFLAAWVSDHYFPPTIHKADFLAKEFKNAFSWPKAQVRFVGCWDTVSSIGFFRRKTLPLADSVTHVGHFRHALALDERRVKFLPEYATRLEPKDQVGGEPEVPCDVQEVWFPGTHSDVGGRNIVDGRSCHHTAALSWMIQEAQNQGLKLLSHDPPLTPTPSPRCVHIQDSLTLPWRVIEFLPLKALEYEKKAIWTFGGYRPHLKAGRPIQPGQKLHPSVCLQNYTPKAVLPDVWGKPSWDDISAMDNWSEHMAAVPSTVTSFELGCKRGSDRKQANTLTDPNWIKTLQEFVLVLSMFPFLILEVCVGIVAILYRFASQQLGPRYATALGSLILALSVAFYRSIRSKGFENYLTKIGVVTVVASLVTRWLLSLVLIIYLLTSILCYILFTLGRLGRRLGFFKEIAGTKGEEVTGTKGDLETQSPVSVPQNDQPTTDDPTDESPDIGSS